MKNPLLALFDESATEPPLPILVPTYRRKFLAVSSGLLKCWFKSIEFLDEDPEATSNSLGNLVLYSNHPSFWDPLVTAHMLNETLPSHHWFAPIEAGALSSHWYFRGLGFFPVQTDSIAGLKSFLQIGTAALRAQHSSALVLTAEGTFRDPWIRPLRLKRGLARLLSQGELADIPVRPFGIVYRTNENPRQSVTLRLGPPCSRVQHWDTQTLHRKLERDLEQLLDRQLQASSPELYTQQPGVNLLEKLCSPKTC